MLASIELARPASHVKLGATSPWSRTWIQAALHARVERLHLRLKA
eukprot:COSAG02_NODE_48516_length_333_cov_0.829060_1_plen_44_part_10